MTEELDAPNPQDLGTLRQILEQVIATGLITQAEVEGIFADMETGLTYDEAMLRLHHLLKGEITYDDPDSE